MLYPVDDFRELSPRDVSRIARLLNERPRKSLDYRTPYEVFSELREELPGAGLKKIHIIKNYEHNILFVDGDGSDKRPNFFIVSC
jgi:hypothetical protein